MNDSSRVASAIASVRLDTSLELLLERAPAAPARGVLATLVSAAGSTYRKPGARMLLLADGNSIGLLSGGCLESDLALHACVVLERGVPGTIEYDMRGPDDLLFGIGAGCEGAMRVLLEPAEPESRAMRALNEAGEQTRAGHAAVLVVVHESNRLALGTYSPADAPQVLANAAAGALAAGCSREIVIDRGEEHLRAFVDFLAPAPHLLICGAGPDALPVYAAARGLGWRVSLIDHRPAFATPDRFPGAHVLLADPAALHTALDLAQVHAAVVMSHHLPSDVAYLRELAASPAPRYVGLLGPAARRERIDEELGTSKQSLLDRLHSPVGLDLGAQTPEAIALAIVSQIHAWLAARRVASTTRPSPLTSSGSLA
jgi:xanthine/CO dehydrogenase XdhC/CoxF family maturation factor